MTRRHYIDNAPSTTLTGSISNSAASLGVLSLVGFPTSYPYTITVDRGTASAEQMIVDVAPVGTTVHVVRNANGQGAFSHTVGATYDHTANAVDFDEANAHVNATTNVHGITGTFVDTTTAQTLGSKTLTGAVVGAVAATGVPGVEIGTSDDTALSLRIDNHAGTQTAGITGAGALTAGAASVTTLAASGAATFSSTAHVVGGATFDAAVTVGTTLGVTGAATVGSLHVTGSEQDDGNSTVTGTLTAGVLSVGGAASVTGNASVGGTLGVTGVLTNQGVQRRVADATARAALTPGTTRQPIYREDMNWTEVWDGTAWRVQGVGVVDTVAHLAFITDPVDGQLASVATAAGDGNYFRWNGTKWKVVPAGAPQGLPLTSPSSAIGTSETAVLTATSVVFRANVAYKASIHGGAFGDAAARLGSFRLRKTNAGGADWGEYYRIETKGISAATGVPTTGTVYLIRNAGTDLTADVVVTLQASAGTVTWHASAATPRRLVIEPCGDAADYAAYGVNVS